MDFQSCFPIWDKLTAAQRDRILGGLISRHVRKGTVIHSSSADCTGLLLVKSGQLRAYPLPSVRPGYLPVLRLLHDAEHSVRRQH